MSEKFEVKDIYDLRLESGKVYSLDHETLLRHDDGIDELELKVEALRVAYKTKNAPMMIAAMNLADPEYAVSQMLDRVEDLCFVRELFYERVLANLETNRDGEVNASHMAEFVDIVTEWCETQLRLMELVLEYHKFEGLDC